jgi:hypothetical protein
MDVRVFAEMMLIAVGYLHSFSTLENNSSATLKVFHVLQLIACGIKLSFSYSTLYLGIFPYLTHNPPIHMRNLFLSDRP